MASNCFLFCSSTSKCNYKAAVIGKSAAAHRCSDSIFCRREQFPLEVSFLWLLRSSQVNVLMRSLDHSNSCGGGCWASKPTTCEEIAELTALSYEKVAGRIYGLCNCSCGAAESLLLYTWLLCALLRASATSRSCFLREVSALLEDDQD
jgi:hypothetical protein